MFGKLTERSFALLEKLGLHILPVHYYSPIPEVGKLRDDIWRAPSELIGIKMNEEYQLRLLQDFSAFYSGEFNNLPLNKTSETRYYVYNGNFGSVDGEIYYCMIRHFKPKRLSRLAQAFLLCWQLKPLTKIGKKATTVNLLPLTLILWKF